MRSEVSGGPGMQSCMSRSLPNIRLDGSPAVSLFFSLFYLNVCNYTRIMMNIIVLHQQIHECACTGRTGWEMSLPGSNLTEVSIMKSLGPDRNT